jgi:hypothetical protein
MSLLHRYYKTITKKWTGYYALIPRNSFWEIRTQLLENAVHITKIMLDFEAFRQPHVASWIPLHSDARHEQPARAPRMIRTSYRRGKSIMWRKISVARGLVDSQSNKYSRWNLSVNHEYCMQALFVCRLWPLLLDRLSTTAAATLQPSTLYWLHSPLLLRIKELVLQEQKNSASHRLFSCLFHTIPVQRGPAHSSSACCEPSSYPRELVNRAGLWRVPTRTNMRFICNNCPTTFSLERFFAGLLNCRQVRLKENSWIN